MNTTNPTHADVDDQLLELGLREVLGEETPPDLSDQILRRWKSDGSVARPINNRLVRRALQTMAFLALAGCLLFMCSVAERGLGKFAKISAQKSKLSAGASAPSPGVTDGEPTPADPQTRTQTYTVMVPQTKTREESYTVMVDGRPEMKTRSVNYTVNVPETRTRTYNVQNNYRMTQSGGYGGGGNYYGGAIVSGVASAASYGGDHAGGGATRKIRKNATLQFVVGKFDGVADRVSNLVTRNEGFVASANLGQMRGEQRSGSWVVRIPTENYDGFMSSVDEVGVLDSRNESAQDVTAQYTDLEARIANGKKLETRILELLERPDDELKDVIEVERELARVRGEIEGMEGQLRVMKDQTSLATVTLNVREERDYVPPTTPTVSSRLSNAWSNGFSRTGTFLMNLSIWFIEMLIPIAVCLIAAFAGWRYIRGWWTRRAAAKSPGA